jgi:peptide-methionine (S)-S-oxide reductase
MEAPDPKLKELAGKLKAAGYELDENDPASIMAALQIAMGQLSARKKPAAFLDPSDCIPGSSSPIDDLPTTSTLHFVKNTPLLGPYPSNIELLTLGMGCFWCSENLYMRLEGVYCSCVGYAGGVTLNPSYNDVCSGKTNHNEVTQIAFDPQVISLDQLLHIFWENHDPTTHLQQGNDCGTQYRSGLYYHSEAQKEQILASRDQYQGALKRAGKTGKICTEIVPVPTFYMGEVAHQQYDAKPGSRKYCGLKPLGVKMDGSACMATCS